MSAEYKVPTSKFARLSKLGGLAFKVASNVVVDGAKQWSKGQSSSVRDLVLQPKNIEHLADKLSQLRGAAMKVGQLLSMDAGDLLPPELSQLLEKLRSNALPMPYSQLTTVLETAWGPDWLDSFSHFELKPFASASIGQVHLAYKENGDKLAVKVQYQGVAQAINSDVDNVAVLLKMSGLLPEHIQIDGLLEEAKKQLLTEADYLAEADFIEAYRKTLNSNDFLIPEVEKARCTESILVMSFIDGIVIDQLTSAPQTTRDKVCTLLIGLFFKELFDFKLMQTDPNFANYLYQEQTDKVVLLDFGATRIIPKEISDGYRALISAGANSSMNSADGADADNFSATSSNAHNSSDSAMLEAARKIGFFSDDIDPDYLAQILKIFKLACEPLAHQGEYDFATSGLAQRIKAQGMQIERQKEQWHTPPVDAIFIHRKLAGLYLLSAKLNARVNVTELFKAYV